MKNVRVLRNFTILLFFVLCTTAYADVKSPPVKGNGAIGRVRNDILARSILSLTFVTNRIPFLGSYLTLLITRLVDGIMVFETTTNHFMDKIIRGSLPCLVTSTDIECEGIDKNGGLFQIFRHAVDTMPDTTPFYIIKKVIGLLLCYHYDPTSNQLSA